MCVRPPCPNCGADYDACFPECPECGHPDGGVGMTMLPFEGEFVEEKVYCKICRKNHIVTKFVPKKVEVT